MPILVSRALMSVAALQLLLLAPGSLHAQAIEWKGPTLQFPPDRWRPPLVPRRIELNGQPTNPSSWVVLYAASDWNRLKNLGAADCATERCSMVTVDTLRTAADVSRLRFILIPSGSNPTVDWLVSGVTNLLGPYVGFGQWVADYARNVALDDFKKASGQLDAVLAPGGAVRYEERLRGTGPYYLDRTIYYRIRVGDEVRLYPIWYSRLRAEIQ
ncbi:MAG TPA: hypothetical protein VGO40_12165 [Longimicrobium sp.]|jgi:hypothetical protein|nr:hypothetical protein [Longimicrobium sp.]